MVTPESSRISGEGWLLAGASAIGTSHLADDKPCQDAHAVHLLPGGGFVAAVSDGAGSAEFSEIGARLAVAAMIRSFRSEDFGPQWSLSAERAALVRECFATAARSVTAVAAERGAPPRQFSCTLTVAIVHPDGSLIATVGDCIAVTRDGDGWQLPVKPARGEYANETTFLTSPGWQDSLQIAFLDTMPDRVALFSDGLMRLALNLAALTPHPPFFDSVFAALTNRASLAETVDALCDFLGSDRVNARTDDDKTLVLAWRAPNGSTP
jgi:hypothetical protein